MTSRKTAGHGRRGTGGGARAAQLRAAEFVDEAISLFESTGQRFWLVRAYPLGVRVHLPLAGERPESQERVKTYAARAVPLLRAYNKPEEAEMLEEILGRLGGEPPGDE